jgi:SAM-dependent methyltransferase
MMRMRVDVLDLQSFYAGPLGQVAQAMIGRRLLELWPDLTGLDVLGYGYATPWLEPWRARARRVVGFMPAAQGVERWPRGGRNLTTIGDEARTPFPDALFDRIVAVHALEEADAAKPMLRELWRLLAPEGRLVLVVANRRGLWARADGTPFGQGRPYSRTQLAGLLGDAMFQPVAWGRALFAPPLGWKLSLGAADAFEAAGGRAWPAFSGVLMVEAVKRLYAGALPGKPGRVLLAQPAIARFTGNAAEPSPKKRALQVGAGQAAAAVKPSGPLALQQGRP